MISQPYLLSVLIFAPWLGAAVLALMKGARPAVCRTVGLVFSLSTIGLGLFGAWHFDPANTAMQFVEYRPWISAFGVHYHLGLDGLSLLLVLLTGVVAPAALMSSWRQDRNVRLFNALFLMLQGSALAVFLALDFFHWFVFWELSLVPAFFLIKLWGGNGAGCAAYQFVVYTIGGSVFMLVAFAAIFASTGSLSFTELAELARTGDLSAQLGANTARLVFLGVLLGLAVKVPLFPFHSWLPSAYASAPTGVSMFLTGVMSKMGIYGFLRILWPLFPAELRDAAPVLLWLALGGIVFGAFAAMAQRDLKRMIAYSSINHVSYCLLALFAVATVTAGENRAASSAALSGALLQVFNHGLSASALFFCIGVLEARSAGRRGLDDFGGIRSAAPLLAGLCGIAMFSSIGLPGLNGFVGEFLIFRGVFGLAPWAAAIGCLGLFATAFFLLTFWQRVFHGPARGAGVKFADLTALEIVTLLPAIVLMFVLGVWPQLLMQFINPLVNTWIGGGSAR